MTLFSWAHRKLRQNPSHDTKTESNHSNHDSHRESQTYDWCDMKNAHEGRSSSSKRPSAGNLKPAEPRSSQTMDHFFLKIELVNHDPDDVASLISYIRHGLLAIGTLGTSNVLSTEEKTEDSETTNLKAESVVCPIEVRELQEELEKVLYTKNEEENAEINQGKSFAIHDEAENDETIEEEKRPDNGTERKSYSGKKIFPLQEFLEIPVEPSATGKKKKKQQLRKSLSNLFKGKNDDSHKSSCEKTEKLATATASANAKHSYSSLIKALFKPNPPGEHHQRTKLEKILHVFRTRNTSRRLPCLRGSDGGIGMMGQKAWDGRGEASSSTDEAEGMMTKSLQEQQEEDGSEEMENWSDEYEVERWCICHDNVWMLENNHEYWIKTDDEYVVLEL